MKNKIFIIILIAFIILGLLYLIKKDREFEGTIKTNFLLTKTEEYQYLIDNEENIKSVKITYITQDGTKEYFINDKISEVYNSIKNIAIAGETDAIHTQRDVVYTFQFVDETEISFYFNGDNLEYKGKRYVIEDFEMLSQKELEEQTNKVR